jgi:hypothetical protein
MRLNTSHSKITNKTMLTVGRIPFGMKDVNARRQKLTTTIRRLRTTDLGLVQLDEELVQQLVT